MANPIRSNVADLWSSANQFEELNMVRLEDAVLCANCEMIVSETLKGKCPVCGSSALLGIARLLGGTLRRASSRPLLQRPDMAGDTLGARAS